jgi:hypothetical protein
MEKNEKIFNTYSIEIGGSHFFYGFFRYWRDFAKSLKKELI